MDETKHLQDRIVDMQALHRNEKTGEIDGDTNSDEEDARSSMHNGRTQKRVGLKSKKSKAIGEEKKSQESLKIAEDATSQTRQKGKPMALRMDLIEHNIDGEKLYG